jgi:hypothetical protein
MSGQNVYRSELQSFRNGVEDQISNHKQKVEQVNNQIGTKAKRILDSAKKLQQSSASLLESGVGLIGATKPVVDIARKISNKVSSKLQAARNIKLAKAKAETGSENAPKEAGNPEGKVDDSAAPPQESELTRTPLPRSALPQEDVDPRAPWRATRTDFSTQTRGYERGKFSTAPLDEEGETKLDSLMEGTELTPTASTPGVEESGVTGVRSAVKGASNVDSLATKAGGVADDLLSKAGTAASDVADTAGNLLSKGAGLLGGEAAGDTFDIAAAATSWLAWLGVPEILGAIGAVTGAVTAGVGVADAVQSAAKDAKGALIQATEQKTAGVTQAAGTYSIPTQDSLS